MSAPLREGGGPQCGRGSLRQQGFSKLQRRSGFDIRRLPPLFLASPFAWSKCALGIASFHFSLLGGVSRHKNTAPWCFCLLTSRRGAYGCRCFFGSSRNIFGFFTKGLWWCARRDSARCAPSYGRVRLAKHRTVVFYSLRMTRLVGACSRARSRGNDTGRDAPEWETGF